MNNKTVLGLSTSEKAIIFIVPPILGALLGWFISTIAEWAIRLPFIPFTRVLEWIVTLQSHWFSVIASILGVLAGIIFAMYAISESLKIIITDERVVLRVKEDVTNINKEEISFIYLDGKHLVLLNSKGIERFRGQLELKKELVMEAFERHGYPWNDKDPFENQYQRWVVDHPDYSPHVNSLLSARERALKSGESEEAKVLRKDLAIIGVVIRDEEKRQYVRIVKGVENDGS